MKKYGIVLAIMLSLTSCSHKKDIPELLDGTHTQHILSFENTRPDVDLEKDQLKEILVLLHHRVEEDKIKEYFQLNDSIWSERINYLFSHGLIKKTDEGYYLPTCFVLDVDNAISIKKFTDSLGTEMSGIAIDRLEKIKSACAKITSLKNIPFENISLFILGSVVHDYWQDKYYQDQFIKSFIPHRGNTDYYLALFQNTSYSNNKIYETAFKDFSNARLGVYSLDSGKSFSEFLENDELKKTYLSNKTDSDSVYKQLLINDLIALSRNPKTILDKNKKDYLEKHDLLQEGKINVPLITKQDSKKLFDIAAIISSDLVNYFENRQTLFLKKYLNSQYKNETSYKEWMTWVYKIISSRVVDVLTKNGVVSSPSNKQAYFILEK